MHPDNAAQRVSHETIYAAIYAHPRGGLKKALVEALRQGDVPPVLSSATVWSPMPNDQEIGHEEAFQRRADHQLPAGG